jgi:hypothetical protein
MGSPVGLFPEFDGLVIEKLCEPSRSDKTSSLMRHYLGPSGVTGDNEGDRKYFEYMKNMGTEEIHDVGRY